jgi:TPR repeat protein
MKAHAYAAIFVASASASAAQTPAGSAQYNIGILYANGQGVPRNLSQARAWMQKAAAAGDEDARDWLAAN